MNLILVAVQKLKWCWRIWILRIRYRSEASINANPSFSIKLLKLKLIFSWLFKLINSNTHMDPNLNRNSMGSRAGTSIKPKFGAGGVGAPSRQGTAGKVFCILNTGIKSTGRSRINSDSARETHHNRGRHQWTTRSHHAKTSLWQKLLHKQNQIKIDGNFHPNGRASNNKPRTCERKHKPLTKNNKSTTNWSPEGMNWLKKSETWKAPSPTTTSPSTNSESTPGPKTLNTPILMWKPKTKNSKTNLMTSSSKGKR